MPFALDEVPLMRVRLLQCAPQRHIVVWTRHHLIVDGWSSALLIQEVMAAYRALARGQRPAPAAAPPYRDYLAWLARQPRSRSIAWWSQELAGLDAPARLPEASDAQAGFAHAQREFDASAAAALAAAHGRAAVLPQRCGPGPQRIARRRGRGGRGQDCALSVENPDAADTTLAGDVEPSPR